MTMTHLATLALLATLLGFGAAVFTHAWAAAMRVEAVDVRF